MSIPGESLTKDASISECGQYRWWLTRHWARSQPTLGFIMLNPSTADHREDDRTIRRCMSFALREGYGGILVVNLYAFRASKPHIMYEADDPVGHKNDYTLLDAQESINTFVCAWGGDAKLERVDEVLKLIKPGTALKCLGTTKNGSPRHPLYVRGDQAIVQWPVDPESNDPQGKTPEEDWRSTILGIFENDGGGPLTPTLVGMAAGKERSRAAKWASPKIKQMVNDGLLEPGQFHGHYQQPRIPTATPEENSKDGDATSQMKLL